eukprot:3729802-Rhodomonas_salina.1
MPGILAVRTAFSKMSVVLPTINAKPRKVNRTLNAPIDDTTFQSRKKTEVAPITAEPDPTYRHMNTKPVKVRRPMKPHIDVDTTFQSRRTVEFRAEPIFAEPDPTFHRN